MCGLHPPLLRDDLSDLLGAERTVGDNAWNEEGKHDSTKELGTVAKAQNVRVDLGNGGRFPLGGRYD